MSELLALPGARTAPRTLDDWVAQLETHAGPVAVTREGSGASWLVVGRLRLRGYAMLAGRNVEAINFELHEPDLTPASRAIAAAAEALGWEVHCDEDDEDEDDEDGDDDLDESS